MATRTIIVGHDLRNGGDDALALGRMATGFGGAQLLIAHVLPSGRVPPAFAEHWLTREATAAAAIRELAGNTAAEAEVFSASSPARGLARLAEQHEADLIVVGSSPRAEPGEVRAGQVALELLHCSPCAVGLAPRGYRDQAGKTLSTLTVGFDGSDESRLALVDAIEMARVTGAGLKLVGVTEAGNGGEDRLREELSEVMKQVPRELHAEATLVNGAPDEKLVDAVHFPGSMLLLGSRKHSPLQRVPLGPVSGSLVRSTPCPLIVRSGESPPEREAPERAAA